MHEFGLKTDLSKNCTFIQKTEHLLKNRTSKKDDFDGHFLTIRWYSLWIPLNED